MNRVLRAGLFLLLICGGIVLVGFGYAIQGGTPDYYPVTVRVWLNDSFVGGIAPATHGTTPEAVLSMLAAGNDLIYVPDDAPRCPVLSVAWVKPAHDTPDGAQVYNATIRC